jgi:hypothetical protein
MATPREKLLEAFAEKEQEERYRKLQQAVSSGKSDSLAPVSGLPFPGKQWADDVQVAYYNGVRDGQAKYFKEGYSKGCCDTLAILVTILMGVALWRVLS